LELADVVKSLRLHWRVSVACVLLGAVGLALFLVTRNQVRPANRYKVTISLLVPAVTAQGGRPAAVPNTVLEGQSRVALSPRVERAALKDAKLSKSDSRGISFAFSASPTSTTITLGATARDPKVATRVATAFEHAYVESRRLAVVNSLKTEAASAAKAVSLLTARLKVVNAALVAIDPNLVRTRTGVGGSTNGTVTPPPLTLSTPIPTVLLVVEFQELGARIVSAEKTYAQNATQSIVASGFASTLEVGSPTQITPALPSPVLPSLVFVGVGLLLALIAPILIDRLDKSIRTAKTAAVAFDSIVMTSVPPGSRRLHRSLASPGTPQDGAYRALAATSIATDRLPAAIVVTSPTGTIQDTVAANFAAALAGLGLRVALIATDARQSWFLDTRSDPDSTGVAFPDVLELAHRGTLDGTLPNSFVKTSLEKLVVLPPGEEDREIRLDGLRPLLENLSTSDVDVTVIAGPAVLEDPNATILAWTTRSVLWAFETGEVTEAEAKEAASRLALAGASSFGIAMVNGKT
jgi:Mrp family chromosome partitioning ATPase